MEALTALLVIVGAIFSVIAKMKDEKKKQDSASRPVPRGVRHEPAKETPSAPMNTPQRKSMEAPAPVQRSFMLEGEDPCHAGGAVRPAAEREPAPDAAEHTQDNEAARELLRGVILSEILERPCERRARLQNRRRM